MITFPKEDCHKTLEPHIVTTESMKLKFLSRICGIIDLLLILGDATRLHYSSSKVNDYVSTPIFLHTNGLN